MATRTSPQTNHSASVTSIKQTLTALSPPPPSDITLPDDFPAHLLLRICDTILEPLLSYNSPLKPHTKPWGRTMNALTWPRSQKATGSSSLSMTKSTPTSSSKGVAVTGCKSDLLAWSYCNRRLWQICGERVYRHVKVSSLNIADILVSRRNNLQNTVALEFYINRDPEPSQAQTDLNLSRFFIQAGVIILWSPRLESLLIDIRSLPIDRYLWDSFLSRLRQRLFVSPTSDLIPSRTNPNDSNRRALHEIVEVSHLPGSPDNTISGFGHEQPTMINSSARWGDSQGVINSPERVSVPHLAIGLGYNAAGELGAAEDGSATRDDNGGFAKMMDQLLSFPIKPVFPPGLVRSITPISGYDGLTFLDLLIPRPSWGHEEAEGHALGMILRRLTGLQRLCLHADSGGAAAGRSGHNEFGLMRKPPYGNTIIGDVGESDGDSTDIGELDMVVSENGAVTYPSHSHGHANIGRASTTSNPRSTGASPTAIGGGSGGNVTITGGAQEHRHRGYGAETWWAGVLSALSGSNERSKLASTASKSSSNHQLASINDNGEDEEENGGDDTEEGGTSDEDARASLHHSAFSPVPPIQELRISVSIPGHVQPQDFDAFYHLILPHIQLFEKLEILIFDMAFAVIPSEGTFGPSYTTIEARYGHSERYVSPGRYSTPGHFGTSNPNERFPWREQDSKANWLMDMASGGLGDLKRHLRRQRYYVEKLIDPTAWTSEESTAEARRKGGHHANQPAHFGQGGHGGHGQPGSIPLRHNLVYRAGGKDKDGEAPVLVKRHSEPDPSKTPAEELPTLHNMAISPEKGVKIRTAPSLRHVYFGEFHGLPPIPPPDVEKNEFSTTRVGRVESVFVDVTDAANAVSSNNPMNVASTGVTKGAGVGPAGAIAVTSATAGSGASGTVTPTTASAGTSGATSAGRGAGARQATGKDLGTRAPNSSVQENQRVVPGMWWSIRQDGTARDKDRDENVEWAGAGRGESLVVQGWEEVDGDFDEGL